MDELKRGGVGEAIIGIGEKGIDEVDIDVTLNKENGRNEEDNDDGGNIMLYCHRHSAVFSPQEVEVDTGLLKGKEIQLVPHYFPCIGEDCMLWCMENDSCQDTCKHNNEFHNK